MRRHTASSQLQKSTTRTWGHLPKTNPFPWWAGVGTLGRRSEDVAPHAEIQAIPILRVCRTGRYAVIVSLERLPEIQPSAVRKDPSLQLWSFTGALTCPVFTATSRSAASCCQQGARLPAAQPGSNTRELAMVEDCFAVWSITRGKKKRKTP